MVLRTLPARAWLPCCAPTAGRPQLPPARSPDDVWEYGPESKEMPRVVAARSCRVAARLCPGADAAADSTAAKARTAVTGSDADPTQCATAVPDAARLTACVLLRAAALGVQVGGERGKKEDSRLSRVAGGHWPSGLTTMHGNLLCNRAESAVRAPVSAWLATVAYRAVNRAPLHARSLGRCLPASTAQIVLWSCIYPPPRR